MVGFGYDLHRLVEGESLILGGVEIESPIGTLAHSDGDVLLHAIIDAILGSIGEGDIGEHFPDTESANKNLDSKVMLGYTLDLLKAKGFELVNSDNTIVLEKPKLSPLKEEIRSSVAKLLGLQNNRVNIKATTNEKQDSMGKSESIVVYSICQVKEITN
ncbi:MAG: 2-C-methyl-D-erythritol 2,4-cyclodiphosphate synthase [Ignavibacteriae bacterium HGW-Ignavibacteriae-4]|jgi:2-C-methyl-D-erythritol 2,4-cyclodiphosphate synthase|nr:MAG: 2-C-methyl-D-erythritol 2,4-cyclodiphosphate synthase [Ignavibacteriae bacterium HGW-Ignavibacteriae-4]